MALELVGRSVDRVRSWKHGRALDGVAVERIERGGRLHIDAEIAEYGSRRGHLLARLMGRLHNETADDFEHLKQGRSVEDQMRLDEIQSSTHQSDLAIQASFARRVTQA